MSPLIRTSGLSPFMSCNVNPQQYPASHDAGSNPYLQQPVSRGAHRSNNQHGGYRASHPCDPASGSWPGTVMDHSKVHGANSFLTPATVRAFAYNERVSVNVEGRGWLVGTVLSFANILGAFTGSSVVVRYNAGGGPISQPFPNDDNHIRRYPASYSEGGGY